MAVRSGEKGIVNLTRCILEKEYFDEIIKTPTVSDKFLFGCLGLNVKSLDASDYEGADFIHDLNIPDLPEELISKFDMIFDGGTIEHVFHIPNVLKNIYAMLKVGGIIIHCSPSNNYIDHGFYQFSPTFFMDYYTSNHFEILECNFLENNPGYPNDPFKFMEYWPKRLDNILARGQIQGNMTYGTWFVAKKNQNSQCSVIPQQGVYAGYKRWMEGIHR